MARGKTGGGRGRASGRYGKAFGNWKTPVTGVDCEGGGGGRQINLYSPNMFRKLAQSLC